MGGGRDRDNGCKQSAKIEKSHVLLTHEGFFPFGPPETKALKLPPRHKLVKERGKKKQPEGV